MAIGSLAALLVASVLAGPPSGSPADVVEGPSPAPPSEPEYADEADDRLLAKQAFDRGLAAVAQGEFVAAVEYFEEAFLLRPHPVTLFNLALALEKADRLPEAWELFDAVVDLVESDAERREVRRHMRTIAGEIAILEVRATPERRICIDGVAMPDDDVADYRLAVEPGRHRIILDDHDFMVDLDAGDRRMLLLQDSTTLMVAPRRGRLMPAMLGTAIGTGGLALVMGVGAAVVDEDRTRTGLAATAATGAGLAVAAGIVALLIETRTIRDPTIEEPVTSEPEPYCPGSPELENRLDLQLAPKIEKPAKFALESSPGGLRPSPSPLTQPVELPRLAGIQPPRALRPEQAVEAR